MLLFLKATPYAKQLWFVFNGMGSQWNGMGREMLNIPIFKESIERSHAALMHLTFNLMDVLMSDDEETFNDAANSFVCIAAIQVNIKAD